MGNHPGWLFASLGLVLTLEMLNPESDAIGLGFMLLLAATFLFFAICQRRIGGPSSRLASLPALGWS